MLYMRTLNKLFSSAKNLTINNDSKIVLMSDCHRGVGGNSDNFANNESTYLSALDYYDRNDYTYIELGDGDELWENKDYEYIVKTYPEIFEKLSNMQCKEKYYQLFGNHDIVKSTKAWQEKYQNAQIFLHQKELNCSVKDMTFYESIVLNYEEIDKKILLIHGHQLDFLNSKLWLLSRFLVRYLWKPAQLIGIKDPFSYTTSESKTAAIDKKLINWTKLNKHMLIAGHTHKTIFPRDSEHLYFNDGSCVYGNYITCLEIVNGHISLQKWSIKPRENGNLYVGKDYLQEPISLAQLFKADL